MNSKVYSQLDSRWGSLPYPKKGSSVAGNACGLFSILHLAIEQSAKATWGPENLRSYMINKGYAVYGQGTTWNGITETLKYIGHKKIVRVWSDPMSVAWKELNKGNRMGIILFNSNRAPNGKVWTSGGHYVAFTDYKYKNKKHYFYIKDSGGRKNTGWYTYENSMKGCIPKLWIVEKLQPKPYTPTKPYSGTIPSATVKRGSTGSKVKTVQRFLNWILNINLTVDGIAGNNTVQAISDFEFLYGLAVDGIFGKQNVTKAKKLIKVYSLSSTGVSIKKTEAEKAVDWAIKTAKGKQYKYKKWKNSDNKTKQCPICNKLTGKYKGWNCIGFITAAYFHGAGLKHIKCSCSGLGVNKFYTNVTEKSWQTRNGKRWNMISNNGSKGGKSIPSSKLKKGDVLLCYDAKGVYKHMAMYIGDGKYIDSTSGRIPNIGIRTYASLSKRMRVTRAFRWF